MYRCCCCCCAACLVRHLHHTPKAEAAQSRFNQQMAAADAQNAKLMQSLSAAQGEVAALRTEVGLLQASRQQLEVTSEQLRHLQNDHQRHMGQLRAEMTEATQELMVRVGFVDA